MAKPDEAPQSTAEHVAQNVFSSEKREDLWALLIVLGLFLLSIAFPEQIHYFFGNLLYLF